MLVRAGCVTKRLAYSLFVTHPPETGDVSHETRPTDDFRETSARPGVLALKPRGADAATARSPSMPPTPRRPGTNVPGRSAPPPTPSPPAARTPRRCRGRGSAAPWRGLRAPPGPP